MYYCIPLQAMWSNLFQANASPCIQVTTKRVGYFQQYTEEQLGYDKDQVGGLVGEVLPQHSCLVFCPTRRSCEAVAEMLCRVLPQDLKQVSVRCQGIE